MNQVDLHTYLQMLAAARNPKDKARLAAAMNQEAIRASRPQLTKNTPPGFAGNAYAMNSRKGGLGPYGIKQPLMANRKGV